jgi:hypothetical protein
MKIDLVVSKGGIPQMGSSRWLSSKYSNPSRTACYRLNIISTCFLSTQRRFLSPAKILFNALSGASCIISSFSMETRAKV